MQIRLSADLWANGVLPLGFLERWRANEGDQVLEGAPLAEVRIEQAVHEILSPCRGRLTGIVRENAVVEPGDVIGQVEPVESAAPSI
ncbi:MAG: lipoyl domain-containing protein [Caulobacteraceae bacterium]